MENPQDHSTNRYIFLSVLLAFALFLFFSLLTFFTAFLGAVMFYVLSKPMVEWLIRKKGWKKTWAAILVIVISFFVILVPVTLLVTMLFSKIQSVGSNMQITIIEPLQKLDAVLQEKFHFTLISQQNITQVQSVIGNFISSLLNQGLNLIGSITMMYFFLYFMIVNINRMEAAIIKYLPFKRNKIERFGHELKAQTFSNAVAVPLIAVVQGGIGYISYLIAGVPEAGFWGILTGIASIIPIVGTGLIWIPIGIYLLAINQTWEGFFVLTWGLVILSSMDNIVRFVLARQMADVHPVITVLGVIIGINYFGITGLVFGPLLISYFIILLQIYYSEYQSPGLTNKKTKPEPALNIGLPFLKKRVYPKKGS
jgi:predicted PurR-regulated permease PerM